MSSVASDAYSITERRAFFLLCVAAFGTAFSLPLGRAAAVLSLLLLVVDCIRSRRRLAFPPVAWGWVAFFAVAVLASAFGVDPARSFGKLDKLLWFLVIPLSATLVRTREREAHLMRAFAAGAGLLAFEIVVCRPLQVWFAIRDAEGGGDAFRMIRDLGSMTDGQMLMLGILALVGVIASTWRAGGVGRGHRVAEGALLVLLLLGLVINLKRGSWICTLAVVGLFFVSRLKIRYLLLLGVFAAGMLLLPPVWSRFSDLRHEFDTTRGGRATMWTRIAPPLVKAHPFGMGYRALTETRMQELARQQHIHVELDRDHLHSNPVQILVSLGWIGLGVYVLWMAGGLAGGLRRVASAPRGSPGRAILLSQLLMLTGLILNGLVEYNFGDGELVLLYAVLLGIVGVRAETDPSL
ncbi:MAG: O-antigen ligase family protein [Verrucomicrobia bacterium]|nr:O-antigen ligase family protein [Verrucomicrobiota bacterium]